MSRMNTTPADLDITATTAAGNTYQVVSYVDPFPGRKGDDVIKETCGKCAGTGVVNYGNVTYVAQGREDRHCFDCDGSGVYSFKVSSRRQTVRNRAKAATARNAAAADYAATAAVRHQEELDAAHTEALAEQARRDNLTQGFLGTEGERLRNLTAVVETNYKFESPSFQGYGMDYKSLLILRDVATGKVLKTVVGARGLERGDQVTVSGTVKSHDHYKGQDQTVLGRALIK